MRERRVLLVEEGWHATLRLARALVDARLRVTVLTANGMTGAHRRGSSDWRCGPALADPRFIAHIDALVAEHAYDWIIPLSEAAMRRLWSARVTWDDRIFPRTSPWQQQLVDDKHRMLEHAAARGIATPRHIRIDTAFDPVAAARELGLPIVVKGSTSCGGRHVRIVDSTAALESALHRMRALPGTWIAQELIASPTYLVGGVVRDGEPLRLYAAEKLHQHPARTGSAIRLRSMCDPALLEIGTRAFRALGWTGFASADVVRRADGSYVLLEVNPRLWGSHAAATASGVDLFAPFVQLLAGESPTADLAFADGVDSWIFPKYFASPRHRGVRGVLRAARALLGDQGRDWYDLRFVRYALRRERGMRRLVDAL